ncbi:MAG: YicC family protein [Spirochaetes bacterium]|nr:MAG: YicC family protein [Spirochaetota bacterium]
MESMTGYGFAERTAPQFSFSTEIRSLNSKYLEIEVNLPRIMRNDESELESVLKKGFGRGKVQLSIEIYDWAETRAVSVDRELLKKYYREVTRAVDELKIKNPVSVDVLLGMEGVISREKSVLQEKSRNEVFKAVEAAMEMAIRMRRREGASTARDLKKSLDEIAGRVKTIEKRSGEMARGLYEKLTKSIEAIAGAKIEDTRLYTEVAILADKHDVNEEIMRLKDHMVKFRQVMKENEQVGKKLDFLAQEMFREINTIGSKANSSEIAHLVVDMKNHIDKIREQCRNIV